jgi:hypothetical protein
VVFLDVRDLLGDVRSHEPARPAHPVGELASPDGAQAIEQLLVLGELGSADHERGCRALGAIEGCDRFGARASGP